MTNPSDPSVACKSRAMMAYNGGKTPAAALSNEARMMKTVSVKRVRMGVIGNRWPVVGNRQQMNGLPITDYRISGV